MTAAVPPAADANLQEIGKEIRQLFNGDDADKKLGLELTRKHFETRICSSIRKRFPSIKARNLVHDVWATTLCQIWQAVLDGKLNTDLPFVSLLHNIARNRAIDVLRRNDLSTMLTGLAEASAPEENAKNIRLRDWIDTQLTQPIKPDEEVDGGELRDIIRELIDELPEKQRIVVRLLVEHYPDSDRDENLRRLVSEETGEESTLHSVRRALQEARKKLRQALRSRGYEIPGK